MQQLKHCGVRLLLLLLSLSVLLLAALGPVAATATARREPIMAATGGEGRDGSVNGGLGDAPGAAAKGGEEVIVGRRRRDSDEAARNSRRFRTRKIPAASQVSFGGRIPFTADYHSVHRHPPAHN